MTFHQEKNFLQQPVYQRANLMTGFEFMEDKSKAKEAILTKKIRQLPTSELKIGQYKEFVNACRKNEQKALAVLEKERTQNVLSPENIKKKAEKF